MKRISKLENSRRGFTLLEVLLAVAILSIASTMIMNGFIATMTFANNNKRYARIGEMNASRASQNIAHYATNSTQMATMNELTDNRCSELTASFAGGTGALGVDLTKLNICVDVSAFVDPSATMSFQVDGEELEQPTLVVNRFSFFYDLGDYLGPNAVNGGHIIRWGYVMSPARPSGSEASYLNGLDSFYNSCLYCDRDGDGLVGNDDPTNAANEFIGYVHYGWYCFNADHNESNCPYRGYGEHNSGYSPAHQH